MRAHPPKADILTGILRPGERLLWSGRPAWGHRLHRAYGRERQIQIALLSGMAATLVLMAAARPIAGPDWKVYLGIMAFILAGLVGISLVMAEERIYGIGNLWFGVTDRRSIIAIAKAGRSGPRWHVESHAHRPHYPHEIIRTGRYPSVRVGSLLGEVSIRPGLAYQGGRVLRSALVSPLWNTAVQDRYFVQIPDAEECRRC